VLSLISELREETGMTLVIVTHDINVAAIAERRIEMRDGCIIDMPSAARVQHAQ
jgi:ABC-type lipoprotein export system ATPase subunit